MQSIGASRRANRLGVLAVLAICGQVFFVAVVALLPLFRPDYSSVDEPISRLLLGPYGYVQSGALFAAGLGSILLAVGLRRATRGESGSLLGCSLIGLWGLGFALAGIILTDGQGKPLESAWVFHAVVAAAAFVSAPAGILVLSRIFAQDARWSSFYPLSLALGFAAVVALIDVVAVWNGLATLAEDIGPAARRFQGLGVIQRVLIGTVILWMILAAARLRSIAKGGQFANPSG